jgi:hypothetical protein
MGFIQEENTGSHSINGQGVSQFYPSDTRDFLTHMDVPHFLGGYSLAEYGNELDGWSHKQPVR